MSLTAEIIGAARHQGGNLAKLLSGLPVNVPCFEANTLDPDDVELANRWLADRRHWEAGDAVTRYEEAFAAWNGSRHAFAFMSGREALSAAIQALGLGPGDEVIVPGYTCVVVPNAFHFAGVETIWCDIELDTFGPEVVAAEARITPRTRALLIHHLYGLVCRDYETLLALARRRGLAIIEDCAQAAGASWRGRRVGTRGDVSFYSSERSKVFNTIQGGLAATDDDGVARRLREIAAACPLPEAARIESQLRNVRLGYEQWKHPQRWWRADWARLRDHRHRLVSTTDGEQRGERPPYYGRRMAAPIAALGLHQLQKVDRYNDERRCGAARWDRWCDEVGLARPLVIPDSTPVFLRYPLLVTSEQKRDTSWTLRRLGVKAGVWFSSQLHPADRTVPGCPNSEQAVARCINLPTLPSADGRR